MSPYAATTRRIDAVLSKYAASGMFSHADACLGRIGSGQLASSRLAPDGRDIYDLASLTKALVTTPLVFYAAGGNLELRLRDLLRSPFSGFGADVQDLTLRQLLRHQSGLPAWRNFYVNVLAADQPPPERLARHNLINEVFQRSVNRVISNQRATLYSDVGFIALGLGLEDYYGKSLADLFREFCKGIGFSPLVYLGYGKVVPADLAVPTGYCKIRDRYLAGEVWDENCAALGGVAGHAGLFGTIEDVSRFLEALISSPLGRDLMDRNLAERLPDGESLLGWRQGADRSSAGFGGGRAAGHLGFTGTAFWLREDDTYSILLTNRVISGRINPAIRHLRQEVFDIYGEI